MDVQLDQTLVQCTFCGKKDKELKLLNCIHSSCVECLTNKPGKIECTKCRGVTDVRDNGIENLQKNFLQKPLAIIDSIAHTKACVLCKTLGRSAESTHLCPDCNGDTLCDDCVKVHNAMTATKSHHPQAIQDIKASEDTLAKIRQVQQPTQCPRHAETTEDGSTLNFFCKTCNAGICPACIIRDHFGHTCHELDIISGELRTDLDVQLKNMDSEFFKDIPFWVKMQEDNLNELERKEEEWVRRITERGEELIRDIHMIRDEQISKMKTIHAKINDATKARLEHLHRLKQASADMESFTKTFMQLSSDVDLATNHDYISTRLQDLCVRINAVEHPSLKSDVLFFDSFPKDVAKKHLSCAFGEVSSNPTCGRNLAVSVDQLQMRIIGDIKMKLSSHMFTTTFKVITGIEVTPANEVFVVGFPKVDTEPCIHVFNTNGDRMLPLEYDVDLPGNICASNGHIYVTDCRKRCVVKMNRDVTKQELIPLPDREDGYKNVMCLTVSGPDKVYVASYATHTIYHITTERDEYQYWLTPRKHRPIVNPFCLCVLPNGDVVFSSRKNHTVTSYSSDQKLKFIFGQPGVPGAAEGQLNGPGGVCCDRSSHIYVSDTHNHRISVLSSEGELIRHIVKRETHGIEWPEFIALSGDETTLFVSHHSHKISSFRIVG